MAFARASRVAVGFGVERMGLPRLLPGTADTLDESRLTPRTDARPPARTRSRAFARAGSVPSAHGPAQREIGLPSVGCHCVRAPGTKRRAARAARRAASR